MLSRSVTALVVATLGGVAWAQTSTASAGTARPSTAPPACVGGSLEGHAMLHASRSGTTLLSLCDGHPLASATRGAGSPLSLASGDFDQDGVPDLVSGFGSGKGGSVSVYRGNVNALWPYGAALRVGPPPAFLANPRTFALPEAPDFLVAGDFDADGHWDLLAAERGSDAMYLLRGDGKGGFRPAERIGVAGKITQVIAGEINRPDGLTDVIVAVDSGNGSKALIYESPRGAMRGEPEVISLPQSATGLALGRFDGEALHDLVIAAGPHLITVHARDRRLSTAEAATVRPARVTMQAVGFTVRSLVSGDFTGTGPSIAALDDAGVVHLLDHAIAPDSMLAKAARSVPSMAQAGSRPGDLVSGGGMSPVTAAQMAAVRQNLAGGTASEWTERDKVALPGGFSQGVPLLVAGRVSGAREDDLLVPDSGSRQLHVLSRMQERAATTARPAAMHSIEGIQPYVAKPMRVLSSLAAESGPVAVLPMRLGRAGLQGLVTLHAGDTAPTVTPQDTPPANIFTVTNTQDIGATRRPSPIPQGPAGSLRAAINASQAATGLSEIVFNIPTTDPGYNATTGTFIIKPYSEAPPGAYNSFALPPINNTVIIDGYTQPGARPEHTGSRQQCKDPHPDRRLAGDHPRCRRAGAVLTIQGRFSAEWTSPTGPTT